MTILDLAKMVRVEDLPQVYELKPGTACTSAEAGGCAVEIADEITLAYRERVEPPKEIA